MDDISSEFRFTLDHYLTFADMSNILLEILDRVSFFRKDGTANAVVCNISVIFLSSLQQFAVWECLFTAHLIIVC